MGHIIMRMPENPSSRAKIIWLPPDKKGRSTWEANRIFCMTVNFEQYKQSFANNEGCMWSLVIQIIEPATETKSYAF